MIDILESMNSDYHGISMMIWVLQYFTNKIKYTTNWLF